MSNDPPIIATDEPTGNLDSTSAQKVLELFEDLVGSGKTILMVTHDQDLTNKAERSILISDWEIVN